LIEKALTRSAQDDAKGIDVQVVNDKVVLSGNVHSQAELDDAKWAAWAAPGVGTVQNDVSKTF
ncbi:MAG: BON domain-containing protein, partial [Chitinophagaceae bacterium]|nr:BON domain-containing protein [Oligoflexus sp.]